MSGTNTGSAATSGGIVGDLSPVTPGGELEVNDSAALVDATDHTVTIGGRAYSVGDVLAALVTKTLVAGEDGSDLSQNPVLLSGKSTSLSSALMQASSSGPSLKAATAAALGSVMVPSGGNISVDNSGNLSVSGLVVAGTSGTDITNQPVTISGKATTLGNAVSGAGTTPVETITASGTTQIPIPAKGDITYIVKATADAALQFAPVPADGQSHIITLSIPGSSFNVLLPTTNVVPDENVTLPTAATTDTSAYTEISYRVVSGRSAISGGVSAQ